MAKQIVQVIVLNIGVLLTVKGVMGDALWPYLLGNAMLGFFVGLIEAE